jgi:hypothetical protein
MQEVKSSYYQVINKLFKKINTKYKQWKIKKK